MPKILFPRSSGKRLDGISIPPLKSSTRPMKSHEAYGRSLFKLSCDYELQGVSSLSSTWLWSGITSVFQWLWKLPSEWIHQDHRLPHLLHLILMRPKTRKTSMTQTSNIIELFRPTCWTRGYTSSGWQTTHVICRHLVVRVRWERTSTRRARRGITNWELIVSLSLNCVQSMDCALPRWPTPWWDEMGTKKRYYQKISFYPLQDFYTKLKEVLGCCIRHLIDGDHIKFKVYGLAV